ncbi:MAG: hypothetical protein AABY22_21310 [Nanoarchaeota archaeon]
MTEERDCIKCGYKFWAEEVMVSKEVGNFMVNDLVWQEICPDCDNEFSKEDNEKTA